MSKEIRVIDVKENKNEIHFRPVSSVKQEELVDWFGYTLCTILAIDGLTDDKEKAGKVKNSILNALGVILEKLDIKINDVIESAKRWSDRGEEIRRRENG